MGAGVKARTAPHMMTKLYKHGKTAVREMQDYLEEHGLKRCHVAAELVTLALLMDRLVDAGEHGCGQHARA